MVATSLQASRARNASNSLIIVAGLGTTGTTAIEVALVRLGLSTAKWNHVVRPAGWTPGVSKPKCSSPTRAFHAMHRLLRQGIGLHTRVQSFRLYDDVDAVLDSPAIDYLPFLLQAYPRSRLILTTRDSAEWARRRAREHKCTPAPFQLWFGAPEDNRSNLYLGPCRPTPRHVLEHSFNAWNSYVRWLAAAHHLPLLELNLFAHQQHRELWQQLIAFVLPEDQRARHVDLLLQPFGSLEPGFDYCGYGAVQERRASAWADRARIQKTQSQA